MREIGIGFLPLFHDWILLNSHLQMSGSPIIISMELFLLILRKADVQGILELNEVLGVRLRA
jgi:hypothetical protein